MKKTDFSKMDLVEWKIVTTSDKCPYFVLVESFESILELEPKLKQCDHPANSSRSCKKYKCPIKE